MSSLENDKYHESESKIDLMLNNKKAIQVFSCV